MTGYSDLPAANTTRGRRPAARALLCLWLAGLAAGCAHVAVAPSWTYRELQEVTFDRS